jgi:transcriptional regulator with XRE-family HTH domain
MAHYWWDVYGPFAPGDDGYPNAGQVVRHYRLLKNWTPAQLGEALGKSARWVQSMEHDNLVPEAISRRRALAAILGIPPVLLGLAALDPGDSPLIPASSPRTKKVSLDSAQISQYQDVLRLYWELDYTSTAQESLEDIVGWIRHLQTLVRTVSREQYQTPLVELMCRYHQLATWIARDQRDYSTAYSHANQAIKLAQSLDNPELQAVTLFRRGRTRLEQGDIAGAIRDLDAALPFAQRCRPQLKSLVLLAAGHARAHAAQLTATDITQAMALIDQAGRIVRTGRLEDDESFVKLNSGRYHQDRAGALIVVGRPSQALDELDLAVRGVGVDQTRRHAYIDVLRSQAYAVDGEVVMALATAEQALSVSKALKSTINIARLQDLCDDLSEGKYKDLPELARLRLQLTHKK